MGIPTHVLETDILSRLIWTPENFQHTKTNYVTEDLQEGRFKRGDFSGYPNGFSVNRDAYVSQEAVQALVNQQRGNERVSPHFVTRVTKDVCAVEIDLGDCGGFDVHADALPANPAHALIASKIQRNSKQLQRAARVALYELLRDGPFETRPGIA